MTFWHVASEWLLIGLLLHWEEQHRKILHLASDFKTTRPRFVLRTPPPPRIGSRHPAAFGPTKRRQCLKWLDG